ASYRLIEPLVYASSLYRPQLQSLSFGLLSRVPQRAFVLSTPRLPDAHHLHVAKPFASQLLDEVFRARESPIRATIVRQLFADCETRGALAYEELFTATPPSRRHRPVVDGLRLQYLGHAGFLIETPRTAILVDPFIANRGAGYADDVISFSELPPR